MPENRNSPKNAGIVKDIYDADLDIIGLSEVNLAWQNVSLYDSLSKRFSESFQHSKFTSCNNRTDSPIGTTHQVGGTILGCIGTTACRITSVGKDERDLGRWSFITLRGNNGHKTHIVSIYRPVCSTGTTSAYQQQVAALAELSNIYECPRELFFSDLHELLSPWQQAGDTIVVGGDFNEDIRSSTINEFFAGLLMQEKILNRFDQQAPNTYDRGSKPIDGIFCSSGLTVTAGGYTEFEWGIGSTHRMVWIDFKEDSFYQGKPPTLWQPIARKLKTEDPRVVQRYNDVKINELGRESTIPKLTTLYNEYQREKKWTPAMSRELNAIDSKRVQASMRAEHKCRRIRAGNVPWSPTIQESINRIRYYRTCIKRYKYRKNINSRTLEKLRKRHNGPIALNLLDAEIYLKEAYASYNKDKKTATELRYSFLADLANAKAEEKGEDGYNVLLQLRQREEQRRMGKRLRSIKGEYKNSISEVIAPDSDGNWIRYETKRDIETKLCKENIRRFTQASTSPCLDPAQVQILGDYGDSAISDAILAGTMNPDNNLHPDLQRLLPFLKTPDSIHNVPEIDLSITLEQYKKGWIRQKESTSSGGQMHFGHFKASAYNDTLANFDRMILELCLNTGHVLPRWKKGTDIMIPKKADSLRVDQLRTICLLPADWNFGNKLLSRRIMHQAETCQTIAPEQYGSRKNKSSIGHATNKSLLYDIQRQKKQDSALLILDAKACYDIIPLHLASLCLRRQGLPVSAIKYMMNPIQNMRHTVRTAYGESKISYKANDQSGYHGILQGNGAGPCIWVMLSTPLLDHLRHEGHGISTTTDDGTCRRIPAIGFVDDVDLTETLSEGNQQLDRPQSSLTTWNTDIRAIAGALQGLKCVWQKLGFHFTSSNRWQIKKIDRLDAELTFEADNGLVTLQRREYNKATLALGVMFSVDGSMTDEVSYLKSKVIKWSDNLQRSNLNRHETWYSVNAGILRSLHYPLLATTMTSKQITTIMAPLFNIALPKLGICRKMTRKAVYCKQAHKGFGIPDLLVQQGMLKLIEVIGRDHETDTSMLLQESIRLCQIEAGLGPNFFKQQLSTKFEKAITNGYIKTLWQFCNTNGISLCCNKRDRIHTHSDVYLMQEWQHRVPDAPSIQDLHACRMYLQVETLSDVTDMNGNGFRRGIWDGIKQDHDSQWPNQPRPSNKAWNLWRQWLAELVPCSTEGVFTSQHNVQYFDYHQWKWFTNEELTIVYQLQQNSTYIQYHITDGLRQRRHQERYYFFTGIISPTLPTRCYPAHITKQDNYRIKLDTYSRAFSSTFSALTTPIWKDQIYKYNEGNIQLLQDACITDNEPLLLVCDGSYKNGYGSAAYVITTEQLYQQSAITGTTRTTGAPSNQDSYRSELTGILAGLLHINELRDSGFFQQDILSVKVICDNIEAIKVSLDYDLHPSISAKYNHFDIIHSIRSLHRSNVCIRYQHVKGHQDNIIQDLDVFEQLNVRMDTMCKRKREQMEEYRYQSTWIAQLPNWKWRAEMNTSILCNRIEHTITTQISYKQMEGLMISKKQIQNTIAFQSIDWANIAKATTSATQGRRRWIAKHHVGMCGVNKWRHIWQDRENDACPRCGDTETAHHIYLCSDPAVKSMWTDELSHLKTWLSDMNTEPILSSTILLILRQLYQPDIDQQPSTELHRLQHCIGYLNFFEGEIHKHWAIEQQSYWERHDITILGNTWARKLITYLWDLRKRFWDARNDVEHAKDEEHYIQLLNAQIQAEITTGFERLHSKYANHIKPDALQKLQESNNVEYKRSWLRNIKAGRNQPNRATNRPEQAHRLGRPQPLITSFFAPINNHGAIQ